jgi:hypothetical protein
MRKKIIFWSFNILVKVKVPVFLIKHYAVKMYVWGTECLAPRIFNLDSSWKWRHCPVALPPRKKPQVPIRQEAQWRSGHEGEENRVGSCLELNLHIPVVQTIA